MTLEPVELLGITKNDIQEIFENTLKEFKTAKTRIIYLDASYLYNFHLDDFDIIKKFNLLGRYDQKAVLEWHRCLERWLGDQTVTLGSQVIKPIQIERTFDRIVNEGLEAIAASICGTDQPSFEYRVIGEGVVPGVYPSDQILVDEVDRININTTLNGGSLSRDGSTIYSIGNHSKAIPSATLTECGIVSSGSPSTDIMLDHSAFADSITHVQNADAPGSTTIIYMCSV